jgi:sugar O-acyltransferase (sialic acid O-acetyltransferase NeuD family)
MKKYAILGQSNYAVAIILDTLSMCEKQPFEVDIIANIPAKANDSLGYAYDTPDVFTREIDSKAWLHENVYDGYFVGSIGRSRRAILNFFKDYFGIQNHQYGSLIHPSSVCARTVTLGLGVHISMLSCVASHARLGNFTVVNRNVSVGHHTILDDFVTLNPGVNVAGCCHIGEGVTVGVGATIVDSINIGKGSIIGAGSVVTRDIPANVVAYGSPAKVIRHLQEPYAFVLS